MPITASVLETAARHPGRTAIAGPGEKLSYQGLVDDSRRVFAAVDALQLAATSTPAKETRGIPITAVSVDSAFDAARIVAGLAGYRAVSAVIDPRWPLEHRVRAIVSTGVGLVIADDPALAGALAAAGWAGAILGLAEFRELSERAEPAPPPTVRAGDEAFLMLFSSGTTSAPKAFLKTRDQYRANVAVSAAHLEPFPGVETLAPGPVSYSLTLYAVIECLATGGGAHLTDRFEPFGIAARIREEGITRLVAVPAVVEALTIAARRDPAALAGLELVVTGGANLPASVRDGLASALPHTRLISYYGAAEIGFIGDSREGDGTGIRVYPEISAEIRDESGARVPAGELGELWILAEACSDGYLSGTSDETLQGEGGWATVHDLGRIAAEGGALELVGRAGDVVATGGHKVALPEIERAYAAMPGIGAACAVALPDPRLGAVVALVVERVERAEHAKGTEGAEDAKGANGAEGTAIPGRDELAEWGRERLAPQYVPRRWFAVERLPRTIGGKVRRGETAALVAAVVSAAAAGNEGVVRL
ncbi:class I adenylate-forming enzyme family protein [Leucobacter luti]|uniref:class I adenylate-forming enzyme family protein n=1 Tax=Leucobacter luti TaxID=340320 RepID=UPI003D036876